MLHCLKAGCRFPKLSINGSELIHEFIVTDLSVVVSHKSFYCSISSACRIGCLKRVDDPFIPATLPLSAPPPPCPDNSNCCKPTAERVFYYITHSADCKFHKQKHPIPHDPDCSVCARPGSPEYRRTKFRHELEQREIADPK